MPVRNYSTNIISPIGRISYQSIYQLDPLVQNGTRGIPPQATIASRIIGVNYALGTTDTVKANPSSIKDRVWPEASGYGRTGTTSYGDGKTAAVITWPTDNANGANNKFEYFTPQRPVGIKANQFTT